MNHAMQCQSWTDTCFKSMFLCGKYRLVSQWRTHHSGSRGKLFADWPSTWKEILCFVYTTCSIDRDRTTCQHTWYPHIRFSAIPCHLHLSGRSRDLFYWIRSKSPRHNGEVVWLFRSKAQNLQNPLLFLNNGKNAMMTSESLMGG